MTSQSKDAASSTASKPKKQAAVVEKENKEGQPKKGKKKRMRGKADKLGLRKDAKAAEAPVKVEEKPEKKKKELKVVSFEDKEEAPDQKKAPVTGIKKDKKGKRKAK